MKKEVFAGLSAVAVVVGLSAQAARAQTPTQPLRMPAPVPVAPAAPVLKLPGNIEQAVQADRAERSRATNQAAPQRGRASASEAAVAAPGVRASGRVEQTNTGTPIKADVVAQRVLRDAKGKERFEPAVGLQDGDVVQFTATYSNLNAVGVFFEPRLSVPPNTTLIQGSIQPPSGRVVPVEGGQAVLWRVPNLPPNSWVKSSLRVRYSSPKAPAAPAAAPSASVAPPSAPLASAPSSPSSAP